MDSIWSGIKKLYEMKEEEVETKLKQPLTDKDVRRIFYDELLSQGGLSHSNPFQKNPRI